MSVERNHSVWQHYSELTKEGAKKVTMEQTFLEKYAELVLEKGVNIQHDQAVVVNAPIEGATFTRILAKKAYELGAKNVHINWGDDELTKLKYTHASDAVIENYPDWQAQMMESFAEDDAAFISIHATDPDLLQDVDSKRVAAASKAAGIALKTFREYMMNDEITWTVISIPTTAWAEKVFPEKAGEEAVQALWKEIIRMVRVDEPDPIQAWDRHNQVLQQAYQYLNDKQYKALQLKAPGTDLKVGLPHQHIWQGGAAQSQKEITFNPNLPTEEVFTAPHKYEVEGTVSSTKPLNYGGNLIDDFQLTFKNGEVIDYDARQGKEILDHLLQTDEGAKRIGEIALVPHESPVSQSGLIFYNTLFDENASCHIALGKAYPTNVKDGAEMDEAMLDEHGINDSMVHVDFMIGSNELDIDGVLEDGTKEPVFRNGTWALDV